MISRCASTTHAPAAPGEPAARLRSVVERLQAACCGTEELDSLLAQTDGAASDPMDGQEPAAGSCRMALRCTTDLNDALVLLPPGYNFSLGCRDGVFWAWSQPNDDWEPTPGEVRHDHPGGSGLIVAQTAALAVTCTALVIRLRWLEAAPRSPHMSESAT
jgi:hypothetical protein